MQLGGLLSALALIGGCWSETLEDGVFSADQWARLQAELAPPAIPDGCPKGQMGLYDCQVLAEQGRRLFFDKQLSLRRCVTHDSSDKCVDRPGIVSCASCHDPKNWFIDTREPNYVSQGELGPTKRNSMTLVNAAMKQTYTSDDVFTWIGGYSSAGAVLDLAINKAMSSTTDDLVATIMAGYPALFSLSDTSAQIFDHAAAALDAYMRRLDSLNTPFDRYLAGDETAIDPAARRGFAVFVGPGGCLDCHSGPLLSDLQPHNTGVPQLGVSDTGHDNQGTFITPPLRHVAKTAPYMHDGVFTNLGDVIAFYRRGGDDNGFAKDPRIVPLDITDDDARDLEAFLQTLTGDPVPAIVACGVDPCP